MILAIVVALVIFFYGLPILLDLITALVICIIRIPQVIYLFIKDMFVKEETF